SIAAAGGAQARNEASAKGIGANRHQCIEASSNWPAVGGSLCRAFRPLRPRPRRSEPFLRPPCDHRQGKLGGGGLQRLGIRRKGRRALPARDARSAAGGASRRSVRAVSRAKRELRRFVRSCASLPRNFGVPRASVLGRQRETANVGKSDCERTF